MIKTIIIDDESLARQRIKNLLRKRQEIEIIGECSNGRQAINAIKAFQPDLILLDIQMKDMNGFEILESLPPKELPLIIFVTAYDQYAIKAFDFFVFDYLLKPFKESRFKVSIDNAIRSLREKKNASNRIQLQSLIQYLKNDPPSPSPDSRTLPIKTGGKISFIDMNDIQYIEGSGYYIEIYTLQKKYLLRESLTKIIQKLDDTYFVRIHRSTIINTSFLGEINSIGFGDVEVHMKDGKVFRVSKSYKDGLFEQLGI